ncbi:hypothetical protein [Siphonobacter sp. SORGH_AS_0500]|uniref:YrzE family protein n=1 Tax=Siphonobacter sp. SORGH_AS_0500 TaxID=1864824 RepID=UPI00285435F6|nr:hypothetical protein [Siphonobacter sp. SORGH_AS_0500]MDR6193189.1 ElaB/YqjD/DUF883 family membrane-anchored ribosome-binding protein [Siphonobacter sp. SORGH_AS_0500]
MEREIVYAKSLAPVKRISWSAVFAGVLIAVVSQLLLSLLGLGIGLSTIDPVEEQNPTAGLGIGTAIWYIISSLLSLLAGGWVAGRLASTPRFFDGIIHGVLTWSLMTLLTIYFLTTTVGSLIGGASRLVGGIVRTAGSAAGSVASAAGPQLGEAVKGTLAENGININDLDLKDLRSEVNTLLRQTGNPALNPNTLERKADQAGKDLKASADQAAENPQATDDIANGLFDRLFRQGQATVNQVDREDAVNVVMKRTNKSRAESEQIVDNWINTYKQAAAKFEQTKRETAEKAREAADKAASAASKGAIMGFFGLLVGIVAAGYGAKLGTTSKANLNAYDVPVQ